MIFQVITKPLDQKRLDDWKDTLDRFIEMLEKVYLAKGPYVNGATDITVGDLLCICELEQPMAVGWEELFASSNFLITV